VTKTAARQSEALESQPVEIQPLDAVRTAFAELAGGFEQHRDLILSQAELSRSSSVLNAWTLQVHLGYEDAIAATVMPHFGDLESADVRPRLVGALVMAGIRLALDDWVACDGSTDLPALIDRNIGSISIEPAGTPASPRRGLEAS
jgi:hypothetical protein